MSNFEEKTIATKRIYDGRIIALQVDDVLLPNGREAKREIVRHPGAVAIIALTNDNKVVLVEQFRKPLGRNLLEIPAGKIEVNEEPSLTARRELEEETGYGAHQFNFIQSFATSPGFADEIIHIYLAEELYKIDNAAALDEDEFVELIEMPITEAVALVKAGKIFDAKTAFALQWLAINR